MTDLTNTLNRVLAPEDLAFGPGPHNALDRAGGLLEFLQGQDSNSLTNDVLLGMLTRSIAAAQQATLLRVFHGYRLQ